MKYIVCKASLAYRLRSLKKSVSTLRCEKTVATTIRMLKMSVVLLYPIVLPLPSLLEFSAIAVACMYEKAIKLAPLIKNETGMVKRGATLVLTFPRIGKRTRAARPAY